MHPGPQGSIQTQSLQPTQHFYPAPNLHREDCRSFMQLPDLPVAPQVSIQTTHSPPSGLHNLHRAHKLSSISPSTTKRGKSALLPFPSLLLPHTALPRTDFLFSPSLCLIPMSWSYLDQSRSIYAHDKAAIGPWAQFHAKKWEGKGETGRGTGAGLREGKRTEQQQRSKEENLFY